MDADRLHCVLRLSVDLVILAFLVTSVLSVVWVLQLVLVLLVASVLPVLLAWLVAVASLFRVVALTLPFPL